jgi:Zn-finger protein
VLPTKFRFILAKQFRRRIFLEIGQSTTRIACLLMDQNEMSNLYRGPSIDAFYHVSYHLAERFQRKSCFRNQPIRNKNCLWWPCLITDQNGMINSHRCFLPRFGPFGQAVSEYKIFRNRPIRNKNCLWWPCLLMDQNEMSNRNRGFSIYASYQVSVHLAQRLQRRRI